MVTKQLGYRVDSDIKDKFHFLEWYNNENKKENKNAQKRDVPK